ncbi:hypothetical protein TNCV_3295911 [Trichonephila clavipes]|uniref:Transposase n=1 Tax=Trichonephila clavipes TaxID=2585209 RepID=A0A8X6SXH7_TRICX|nr:hypothetical protein TNCV_3295911 [Trichonephila clavipes]
MSKSYVKTLLIMFFDSKEMVLLSAPEQCVLLGQTMNSYSYFSLEALEEKGRLRQRSRLQTARVVTDRTQKYVPMLSYPPYSPQLALCDFFLFSGRKMSMKKLNSDTPQNVQKAATTRLRGISQKEFGQRTISYYCSKRIFRRS